MMRYRPPWAGDHHLYAFDVAGRSYGDPARVDDVKDDMRLTVTGVLKSGVRRFTYTYDFGDDWEHEVAIEGKRAAVDGRRYPACGAGKRNCPPEDCGGVCGYQNLLAALAPIRLVPRLRGGPNGWNEASIPKSSRSTS